MTKDFIPKNFSGKLAVGSGFVLACLMLISIFFAVAIEGEAAVVEGNFLLSIFAAVLSVLITLAAPVSFLAGIYTIVKYKDWSVFKLLGFFYVLALLFFLLGEFLFQH